jgi:indoleacetamide hydrolase
MSVESDWSELGVGELAQAIAQRRFKVESYAAAMLERHEHHKDLGHACWLNPAEALRHARDQDEALARGEALGPIGGVPMLVKDNINTAGYPTSTGTPALKRYHPQQDAAAVRLLKCNGAYVLGKANMHEMAVGGTCANLEFGFVRNPYNPAFVPGGSSGGSAVAVAAGITPFSLGTDTMGSVRIPASYCGVVGFRPTCGAERTTYPARGAFLCAQSFDTIGPITRTVTDVRLIHAILSQRPQATSAEPATIRVGVPEQFYWAGLDSDVDRIARSALDRIDGDRVTLVPVDIGNIASEASELLMLLLAPEMSRDIPAFLANECPHISTVVLLEEMRDAEAREIMRACLTAAADASALEQARSRRAALVGAYRQTFERHRLDVIAFPTTPVSQVRVPDASAATDRVVMTQTSSWAMVRNTAVASVFGAPSLTLPMGALSNHLPLGLCLDGLPGEDDAVLAVGAALEAKLGRLPRPKLA